jgi:hypothetical protein
MSDRTLERAVMAALADNHRVHADAIGLDASGVIRVHDELTVRTHP